MPLRISGGYLKGRGLDAPAGGTYRPLTGRFKKTLFDFLGSTLAGATVLDLFGGAGVMGIEALSRGAARVTFVENNGALTAALERNLVMLGLSHETRIYTEDVLVYLGLARPSSPYDIVFLDPPYGVGLMFRTIEALAAWPGFGAATLGMAKTFKKERFAGPAPLKWVQDKIIGDDKLIIFGKE